MCAGLGQKNDSLKSQHDYPESLMRQAYALLHFWVVNLPSCRVATWGGDSGLVAREI